MTYPEEPMALHDAGTNEQPFHSGTVSRWVAPLRSDIPRTEHGLLDAVALSHDWYAGDLPRRAEDLIGSRRSYVLLAPSGGGKTTLIGGLKRCESDSVWINLRLHDLRSLTELLDSLTSDKSLSEPGRTVYVDAIDEALLVKPNIGYELVSSLDRPGYSRLRWRLACRPASWTVDLTAGLSAALPGFEELELLPLSLVQIKEMAGVDADQFLADVEHARLTGLLAHPLHALNLLDHWRESGRLPVSRSEAMRYAVTDMLAETSITRPPGKVDDRRRLLIAERLAATSMFCGAQSFALRPVTRRRADRSAQPSAGEGPLAVSSIPTQPEPDLPLLVVDDIREVLGTALFAAAGQGSVAFVHRSYAEFLAAAYLARRGAAGMRLRSILGADVNGLVPRPMIEVLGWLLALDSQIPDGLIMDNAKQLLDTSGLELIDEHARKRIVEALLHAAAVGTIDEGWRADTSVLFHPDLVDQLRTAAHAPANRWVVFWICRIARQCAVSEVIDDLLMFALEPGWPDFVRAEAVKAFAEVAPRDRLVELVPLLGLGVEEDSDDEILAAALRAILPDGADFATIRIALRPRRRPNYIGNYYQLLRELPSLIPEAEVLPTLTDAVGHRREPHDEVFDRLIGGLLQRAWEMRDPASAVAIGVALGRERLSRSRVFRGENLPWATDDDPGLRRVIAAAALAAHEDAFVAVLDLHILTPGDIGWLIDWMLSAPPESLAPALVTLSHLAWNVADAETVDRILGVGQGHPAFEVLAAFHGHREISSRPRWAARTESAGPSTTELDLQLRRAVSRAREDVNEWWEAVIALAGDWAKSDPEILTAWDLTERPMWSMLTDEEQDAFLRLGLDYLNSRRPDVNRWLGRDQFKLDDAMPDWAAVFLFATLAAHHKDLLAEVGPAAWTSWGPVITAMPTFSGQQGWQRQLRDAASEAGRDAIAEALREQLQQAAGPSFALHPFADFSDARLMAVVEQVARNTSRSDAHRDEAIGVLIEHAPDIALDVARTAIGEALVPPAAFAALAKLAPDELVEGWIAQGQIGPVECLSDLDPDRLSDTSLTALTAMLLDDLPTAVDPAKSDGFVERTPESIAHRLLLGLLQSMAGRGMTSQLAALEQHRPAADPEYVRHLLQEARTHEALVHWQPLAPNSLMSLLDSGDARMIRDSEGLLTVLLEQLDQIQHEIHGRAAFRRLWDHEPGHKGASPKSEDTISDWLKDELGKRLRPHVVVDREIQVTRRKPQGSGTRIDLTVTSAGVAIGRVVFEAKLVSNTSLMTAIDDQLVSQYMEPAALTHGIYIVYWTIPTLRRTKKHPNANVLAEKLRAQARRHLPNKHIEVVIMDIGPPS